MVSSEFYIELHQNDKHKFVTSFEVIKTLSKKEFFQK